MRFFTTISMASQLQKWRDIYNVQPNYRIEKCSQLLDTCITMEDWPDARSSWVSVNLKKDSLPF
jgi:hypothetical protein